MEKIIASGLCGENTNYILDSNGIFTLKGMGTTADFMHYDGSYGNFEFYDGIKKVIIEEGITKIGSCFFCKLHNLESIEFPITLKEIGQYAFIDCISLKHILLKKVENIREGAFQNCLALESIDFGDEINIIERNAFSGCKKIKTENVIFPDIPIINIHHLAFQNTSFDMENIVN